jgi:hypothetical protein
MGLHWGVDTAGVVTDPIRTPPQFVTAGEPVLQNRFEWIARRVGRWPEFWGRYLTGAVGVRAALTIHEVIYLHQHKCKILPIWNPRRQLVGGNARLHGRNSARAAIERAGVLDIPRNTTIYADLERWYVDAAWFEGWFEETYASEYGIGGIYGNVGIPQRRGPDLAHSEGFRDSLVQAGRATDDAHFDQTLEAAVRGAPLPHCLVFVWSNRPYLNRIDRHNVGSELAPSDVIPSQFRPMTVPAGYPSLTVLWQYAANVRFQAGGINYFDLNLSTDPGFNRMWS